MRTVVIKDTKIPKDELLAMLDSYSEFIEKNTGIVPVFWVEQRDFSQVPTVVESDGDMKPTTAYMQRLCDDVHRRYGNDGTDNVTMLVHEDNFLYKGIWGQNWSYLFHTYSFQLCRWDKDNVANSFGTMNHELMHSFDAVVLKETGFDLNILGLAPSYDKYIVHGGRPDKENTTEWKYVRYQENTRALKTIAPYLARAYKARKDRHLTKIGMMGHIVKLLSTVVALLTAKSKL